QKVYRRTAIALPPPPATGHVGGRCRALSTANHCTPSMSKGAIVDSKRDRPIGNPRPVPIVDNDRAAPNQIAAMPPISTRCFGVASGAPTVARAGVLPFGTHLS